MTKRNLNCALQTRIYFLLSPARRTAFVKAFVTVLTAALLFASARNIRAADDVERDVAMMAKIGFAK